MCGLRRGCRRRCQHGASCARDAFGKCSFFHAREAPAQCDWAPSHHQARLLEEHEDNLFYAIAVLKPGNDFVDRLSRLCGAHGIEDFFTAHATLDTSHGL